MVGLSEEAPIGSIHAVKNLYNHSTSARPSHAKWSESSDPVVEERRLKEMGQSHAVVHRFSRCETKDGEYAWKTHSVEVKSPRLRTILTQVFSDYGTWSSDSSPFTFYPPFKPLVHRWDKILGLAQVEHDEATARDLNLLCQELSPLLSNHFSALEEARSTNLVSFDSLWLVLAPADIMLSYGSGNVCASRLREAELIPETDFTPPYWVLTMDRIDWNGNYFGFEPIRAKIPHFAEPTLAFKLCVHPLDLAPNRQEIRNSLLDRGRKFESQCGFHVQTCAGKKFVMTETTAGETKEVVKPVSGRVIVDAFAYYLCQEKAPPTLARNSQTEPSETNSPKLEDQSDGDNSGQTKRNEQLRCLTDIECIIANPRVKGFDLKTKEWCEFNVDEIYPADWNDRPYEKLVLPPGEKELVIAFADRDKPSETKFDDFVHHKGEGIIILLCGPPGVGKTLTAEAVAEKSKVPLYILSAGDLGTTPEKVEAALGRALLCCELWNAVLLFDEADVFLECRDSNSLERNELVAIFLRQLEYYQGLLFLTTNRIDAIDPAFKSRIDLIIPYSDLDAAARRQIWVNFISLLPSGTTDFCDTDYDELSKFSMNGREVKNTIKTALVLSTHDKPFRMRHLRIVLDVRKKVASQGLGSQHPTKRRRLENHE